jgi:hypothetical protein
MQTKEHKMDRNAEWNRLIELLDEADAIQQTLLGDKHAKACYEFHNQLNNIADELVDFANAEGVDIA